MMVASPARPGNGDAIMAGETILVVDDDASLRDLICGYLADNGYQVHAAAGVEAMRGLLGQGDPDRAIFPDPVIMPDRIIMPDLIIMDVMMPDEDGLAGMRWLQGRTTAACIMLSTMAADVDRIVGLELGADDYIAKPCNPRELLARVRAVLRRRQVSTTAQVAPPEPAGWTFDTRSWQLIAPDGSCPELSKNDLRLLLALVDADGRVLSRDQLIAQLDPDMDNFDRAIDVQVSRLRKRLALHGGEGLVRTVRGFGYGLGLAMKRI
ncbi:response regulator transcription factor [Sphingomonas sp. 35-24ZXX]|uniref:response regulator transcription factor n=1 Tax=Sphingomonas sp. 35-24ZXX TaxID=1545915 RepID=UPI00068FD8EB|nr:response regulator transcription factor [Sphingomonas sp. 35-24ZXX]